MQSWPAPHVPRLPGTGPALRVHDVAAGVVRPLAPGRTATLYVCGITPYDATHLGHAATYLAFDLLSRTLIDAGHEVRFVENVTDVDEPLLERAERDGHDWRALAERETQLFRDDMAALRVLPPAELVGAVEAIPDVVDLVERLEAAGATYRVDGDLYLSVREVERFGSVASLDRETMTRLSRDNGGDPDRPGKRDPLDSILWRAEVPGEPAWDTALGRGRPGWHVECAAIAASRLGESYDVLGGGADLLFPHHEHSCATTSAAGGTWPVARAVVHAGLVAYEGEKMSKSRGNLVFVSRLRQEADPGAIRLAVLAHHYRSPWEWTDADLPAAEDRLARWRTAVAAPAAADGAPVLRAVREALADDLDAPRALGVLDRWAEETRLRGGRDREAGALLGTAVDALLGVRL